LKVHWNSFSLASKGQYFVVCLLIDSMLQNPYFDVMGEATLVSYLNMSQSLMSFVNS